MGKSKFYQIKNITEHEYILVGCDGSVITLPIQEVDKTASAFTIQDAKDGDVFVTSLSPEGDWIGLYKESTGDSFKTHCYLSTIGEFVINPNRCKNHGTYGLHPATKEQRDLLSLKMKEVGYEWDVEKKELKRITN